MVAPNDTPVVVETAAVEQQAEQPVVEKVVKPVEAVAAETVVAEKPAVAETDAPVVEATPAKETATEETVEEPEMDDAAMMSKAKLLLAEGKVAYVKLAYEAAQDKLSECCELISKVEGEKAASLYTPMLYLAKTLLDLSRMEQPVVENALTGVEDTADDSNVEEDKTVESKIDKDVVDEKNMDEVADKVIEALDENAAEADAAKKGEKVVEADAKVEEAEAKVVEAETKAVDEKTEEVKEPETTDEAVTSEGADAEMEEECDGDESTATEDITNIQLAYENAATARLIASTELDKAETDEKKSEWKANVAEALLVIGEICIADEEYENALTELTACEKVQTEIWSASDRRLADTYFQFGRAYTNMGRFPEASEVYGKALKVITLLKEETSTKQTAEADESKKTELGEEVTKLDALIKDIESWVKDSIDSHKSRMEATEEAKKEEASGSTVGTVADKGADAANDITGLVRKRKADSPAKAAETKVEATPIAGDSPMKENGVEGADDAAVAAKKARLSSEADAATKEEVAK